MIPTAIPTVVPTVVPSATPTPSPSPTQIPAIKILVGGVINQDTIWTSGVIYEISSTLIISEGIELVIEPSTRIELYPGKSAISFDVEGRLTAVGTSESPILFKSVEVNFKEGSTGVLNNVVVDDVDGPALLVESNDVEISESIFRKSLNGVESRASPTLFSQNTITANQGTSLLVGRIGEFTASNNTISHNGTGVLVSVGLNAIKLEHNNIFGNTNNAKFSVNSSNETFATSPIAAERN